MDENVKPYEFVRYFKKADKNMLMEADELLFIKRSPMKFWYIEGSVKEEMSRHFHGLWTWKRRNGLQNGLVKNLRYIAQKSRKKMCWHTLTVEENQNWC